MNTQEFDELAGRIEGLSRAVLSLTVAMERQALIEGPRLSQAWRDSVSDRSADTPLRSTARKTLQELAAALDDARNHRQ